MLASLLHYYALILATDPHHGSRDTVDADARRWSETAGLELAFEEPEAGSGCD